MRQLKRSALIVLLALAASAPAFAQETRGSIEGVVRDASGAVLPGVTVDAKSTGGATASTTSDARGAYRFPALPVGTYTVAATLTGFNTAQRGDILLTLGQQLRADLTMTVGAMSETVSVTAESPIVDVKKNSVSTTITAEVLDLIPKGRDFLDALTGIPGTNNVSRAGGIMIDGATSTENRYVVDGMDVTSLDEGDSGKRIIIDFVEQIQVQRSGYNPEYRAATGGVISAISKSGANRFHGELGLNYSGPTLNRSLQGNVRPTLQISPLDDETLEYIFAPRVHDTSNVEPVFQFSGPVLENRLWFFLGVAPSREKQTRTVTWRDVNPQGAQTQTFEDLELNNQFMYSVTSQLGNRMRARFNGSNGRDDPGLTVPDWDAASGVSTANPRNFNPQPTIRTFQKSDSYSGSLDWTATDKLFVNLTSGWYQLNSYSDGGEAFEGTRRTFANSNLTMADVPVEFRRASGFADNPSNTFNEKDAFQRLNFNVDMTTYRTWKGQHSFKAGVQYERLGNSVNVGQQFANISFNWNRSFQPVAGGPPQRGTYGYYTVTRAYTSGDVASHNVGLFLQDQWSVSNRLTFNYGVRLDRTHMPSYRPENPSLGFSFGEKVAPRIGFAYDVGGDGRWKAYGSWGVFYDIEKLEMPRGLWGADHAVNYTYTLDTPDWTTLGCADVNGETGCPGRLIERLDRRHVSNSVDNMLVDPNLKPMRAQEATIGLDHELSNHSSIGVRYTHKWLNRAIEDVGVIDPVLGAEIFYIANPGEGVGAFPLGPEYPQTPKARRVYDGIDISFNRRLHNNWSLNTSLLFSRLWGNYTGLSNGQSESGRQSPNVTRAFDGLFMSFDSQGNANYGRMGTDIPVQFKALATYMMPWGTSIGIDQRVQSGLLHTTSINFQSVPVAVYGFGDLGRTPTFSTTNLLFGHTFRMPRNMRVNVQLNVNNLFDQDTVTAYDTTPYLNGSLSFPNQQQNFNEFFAGFDPAANMAAVNAQTSTLANPDPRYGSGRGTSFQGARSVRIFARFSF
jgi:outer membrane receptor protein involved in Fe transport